MQSSDHPVQRPHLAWPQAQWQEGLEPRMCQHVTFARDYARRFAHGAPGHLDLMAIAKLADLLDELECNGALQRIER